MTPSEMPVPTFVSGALKIFGPFGTPRFFGKLVCDSVHPNWFASDTAFQHFERQSNEENQTVWKQPYRSTEALQ